MSSLLVGILTCSNECASGDAADEFGRAAIEACAERGFDVVAYHVCPEDIECIESSLIEMCDVDEAHVVLTLGGTGLRATDVMPEATASIAVRELPGVMEALRAALSGDSRMMLSRGLAVQRGRTLVINLPATEGPSGESIDWILDRLGEIRAELDTV
ncbi:MAG: MogA/MoaB family molybdenum cofactor biosynthesis protein [Coriobacteriia bacterium]